MIRSMVAVPVPDNVDTGVATVTVTIAERPVLVALTTATPDAGPALNAVAVVPAVPVCPLGGLSGWVASATPMAGVVVRLQATVVPARGTPCRSCTVAVIRSVPLGLTVAVAARAARRPGIPVSIRKW